MFSAASKSASGGKLTTETFTSNTTWVAPAGVSVLRTMSGYGGAATPDTFNSNYLVGGFTAFSNPGTSLGNAPFAQWGDLYADLNTALALISGNSGVNNLPITLRQYRVGVDDTWYTLAPVLNTWVSGSTYSVTADDSPLTSGNILYSYLAPAVRRGWTLRVQGYDIGGDGAAASAVGKTFPGGTLAGTAPFRTAVAPVTTTFTGVAVTPGVSYSIVVPSGGSLTITYIG